MDKNKNNDNAEALPSSRRRFLRNARDCGATVVATGLIGAPITNYALNGSSPPKSKTPDDGLTNVAYNITENGTTLVDAAQTCPSTPSVPTVSINIPAVATALVAGAAASAAVIDSPTRRQILNWTKKVRLKETENGPERT